MTRDEAITAIATTTVLDHDAARRCVEAMPNVLPIRAVRVATDASILAQGGVLTAVEICKEFALAMAVARDRTDQTIARMTKPRDLWVGVNPS